MPQPAADRPNRHRQELPLNARLSNAPVAAASPHATSGCRPCCAYSPSAAATGPNARLLTRLAKLDLLAIRRLEDRHRCATPSGVTSPRSSRTGPSAASTRIASQLPVTDQLAVHRRRQPSRRHLRPACSTTRTASSGPSARCDGHTAPRRPVRRRRHQHPNAGLRPGSEVRPAPARRQSRRGRPAYGSRRRHGKRARYAGG